MKVSHGEHAWANLFYTISEKRGTVNGGLGKVLTLAEPTRVTGVKEGEALVFKKNGPQRP